MKIQTSNSLPLAWESGQMFQIFRSIDSAVNDLQTGIAVTKTASFELSSIWTICNGSGTITVTLPNPVTYVGQPIHLKTIAAFTVVSASANVVPLIGGAAGTAILAATAGKWATLVTDGANWVIMEGN